MYASPECYMLQTMSENVFCDVNCETNENAFHHPLYIDLPVDLPLTSIEEFSKLEKHLKLQDNFRQMVAYLSFCKGNASPVDNCLQHMMSDKLACHYSYNSTGTKRAFSGTLLHQAIICAVTCIDNSKTQTDVVNDIRVWLFNTPVRLKDSEIY